MKNVVAIAAIGAALISTAAAAAGDHAGGHPTDAIGQPGASGRASRTVEVEMNDAMRFVPAQVAVRQGETVRFVVRNAGKLKHEMVLGTVKALKEHDDLMKKHPGMEHADENMVTVAPGETGEILWQFTRSGRIAFACLQPGHYDAGMKGSVDVSVAKRGAVERSSP